MISMEEITMGREKQFPKDFTKEVQANLKVLHEKINTIRAAYGKSMIVSSGWRNKTINDATPGAAKNSKHMIGLAIDIYDKDGELFKWVLENLELMKKLGVYIEDKRYTLGWTHFGIGAPSSLKRIFKPNSKPAPYPNIWNGKYDSKWDGPEKE
jgi:hypothetical protein